MGNTNQIFIGIPSVEDKEAKDEDEEYCKRNETDNQYER